MKKLIILSITTIMLVSSLSLVAVSKKDLWISAVAEKDLNIKLQKLNDYKKEYDDPNDENRHYLYINLTYTAFQLQKYSESIALGEQTLQLANIQDNHKLDLYLILANSYNVTNQDLKKANDYADLVIATAENMKKISNNSEESVTKINNGYIVPALRIQARVGFQLGKNDITLMPTAADKALAAYALDKSSNSIAFAYEAFKSLAKAQKNTEAIAVMEKILAVKEGQEKDYENLGILYNLVKNTDRAIELFEKAYAMKTSAEGANRLGKMLYKKKDLAKAIEYLADEFAYTQNKEADTYKLLEHLYFNQVYKDKTPAEKEEGFKLLLETAKGRITK